MLLETYSSQLLLGMNEALDSSVADGQYREGFNVLPSTRFGLIRRMPFSKIDTVDIGQEPEQSGIFSFAVADGIRNIFITFGDSDIAAVDIDTGEIITVFLDSGVEDYLQTLSPREDLFFAQKENNILVCNRSIAVFPDMTTYRLKPNIGTAYVRLGQFSSRYQIFINDVLVADLKTQDPLVGGSTTMASDFIALSLADGLSVALTKFSYGGNNSQTKNLATDLPAGMSYEVNGNVIIFSYPPDAGTGITPTFTLDTSDSNGDRAMISFIDEVQAFGDLPPKYYNNHVVKVTGESNNEGGAYFQFETRDNNNYGAGTWVESYGWHPDWRTTSFPVSERVSLNNFDATTMPVVIKYNPIGGVLNVYRIDWVSRHTGDCISNPFPSFVTDGDALLTPAGVIYSALKGENHILERYIRNICFYHNRLGILRVNGVSFSVAYEWSNFFSDSALAVIDSDPVECDLPTNEEQNICHHAILFMESLLLCCSQNTYAYVPREGNITPLRNRLELVSGIGSHEWVIPAVSNDVLAVTKNDEVYVFIGSINKALHANHIVPSLLKDVVGLAITPNVLWVSCKSSFVATLHFLTQVEKDLQYSWNIIKSMLCSYYSGRVFHYSDRSFWSVDHNELLSTPQKEEILSSYQDEGGLNYPSYVQLGRIEPRIRTLKLEYRHQVLRFMLEMQGDIIIDTQDDGVAQFSYSTLDPAIIYNRQWTSGIDVKRLRIPVMKDSRKAGYLIRSIEDKPFKIGLVSVIVKVNTDVRMI